MKIKPITSADMMRDRKKYQAMINNARSGKSVENSAFEQLIKIELNKKGKEYKNGQEI